MALLEPPKNLKEWLIDLEVNVSFHIRMWWRKLTNKDQYDKTEQLKPCPWCPPDCSDPDLFYHGEEEFPDEFAEDWKPACHHCGCTPVGDCVTRQAAINAWNERQKVG